VTVFEYLGRQPRVRRRSRISAPARSKPLARGLPARARREQAGVRGGGEGAVRRGGATRRGWAGRRGGAAGHSGFRIISRNTYK